MVADQHRQVQAEIRNVRKGPPRVERQGSQHREHRFGEVFGRALQLLRIQLRVVVDQNTVLTKRRQKLVQAAVGVVREPLVFPADGNQLRPRAHAVGTHIHRSGIHLGCQSGHTHHEELVQVGAKDRQKLHPLQQRIGFVFSLFQHTALEGQQAQFTVQIERTVFQIDIGRGAFGPGSRGVLVWRSAALRNRLFPDRFPFRHIGSYQTSDSRQVTEARRQW